MKSTTVAGCSLALLLLACHKAPADRAGVGTVTPAAPAAPSEPPAQTVAPAAVPAPASVPAKAFSIDAVPVSNAPLGAFPYFGLPPGTTPQNAGTRQAFGHFTFWTGSAFHDAEGQTFMETIVADTRQNPGAGFEEYAVKKNMEALFAQAGAVKIFDGRVPMAATEALPSDVQSQINQGFGDGRNSPSQTWVAHRPGGDVWIYLVTNSSEASFAVVAEKPFAQTAALLPADALKVALEQTGKATIHLNFAIDQTAILPTSAPQVAAVVALLQQDATLRLAINGYTDDAGSDAHNQALSDGRASAVRAALTAAGIAPDRLQAKGYGRTNPVAANTDEAGRAANRRVELIRL